MSDKHLSQSARRKPRKLKDPYGRTWETTFDVVADDACAPINPHGWDSPLVVPQKYLRVQPDDRGLLKEMYGPWLADLEAAHKEYEQRLFDDAMTIFGHEGPKAYEDRSPALLRYTGVAPQAIEPVLAAMQGNKWMLGLTDKPDPRLTRFFVKETPVVPDYSTDYSDEAEEPETPASPRGERGRFAKAGG
jgi:hypothetical protein